MIVMVLNVKFLNRMTVEHVRIGNYLSYTVQLRFSHVETADSVFCLVGIVVRTLHR